MSSRILLVTCAFSLAGCDLLGRGDAMLVTPVDQPGGGGEVVAVPGGGSGGGDVGTVPDQAHLTISVTVSAAAASVGQELTLDVKVLNNGGFAALGVAPGTPLQLGVGHATLLSAPTPAVADIEPGQSHTFSFRYRAADAGALEFQVNATGLDSSREVAITSELGTAALVVNGAAMLAAQELLAPMQAMTGAEIEVAVRVANVGQSEASAVAPTALSQSGAGQATLVSGPTPASATLAPGATQIFRWRMRPAQAGDLTFSVAATGVDGSSGLPLSADPVRSVATEIDTPPQLVATLSAPAMAVVGESFVVSMLVRNTGTALARAVVPAPGVPSISGTGAATTSAMPPAGVDIPGGGSASFSWPYTAGTMGAITFSAGAGGTDVTGATVVAAGASSGAVTIALAPQLDVVSLTAPAFVLRGQPFTLTMMVKNSSGGLLGQVQPSPPSVGVTGLASASTTTVPAPVDVAAGATATFTWSFRESGTGPGTLSFSAGAVGSDAALGRLVNAAPKTSSPVSVSGPALLAATLAVPGSAVVGQTFTVTLSVANSGQSQAAGVTPSAPVLSGAGRATLVSGPTPASAAIAQGASQVFAFTYRAGLAGPLAFTAGASGTDAAGGAVVAPQVTSSQVSLTSPAALSATLTVPASVTAGQPFTATMVVRNSGGSAANLVRPSPVQPVGAGTSSAASTTSPAAVSIAAGASATFTWQYVATGAGSFSLSGGASGTDAATGGVISAAAVTSNACSVVAPGMLSVSSLTVPSLLSPGQAFDAVVTVRNGGGATVRSVRPNPAPPSVSAVGGVTMSTASAPAAVDLTAGASASFTYRFTLGSGTGSFSLSAGATGLDVAGATVTAPAVSSGMAQVQLPAALVVETSGTLPSRISRGQAFTVSVVVRNTGGTAASGVRPTPVVQVASGAANAATSSAPVAQNLAPGASATYTYSYVENGTGPGALRLSVTATGVDASTAAAVNAPAVVLGPVTVDAPAALAVTQVLAPATLTRGGSFAVTVTVTNSGQAAANAVLPNPSVPAVTVTGGAVAASSSAPAAVTIAGGSSQTFTYAFTENGTAPGTLVFSAAARGTDANSGAAVSATSVSSSAVQVLAPSSIAVTSVTAPATVANGQTFDVVVTVRNSGTTAVNGVLPSPAPPSAMATGLAAAVTSSAPAAQSLLDGASGTFTYAFRASGTGAGTLVFSTGARGTDAAGASVVAGSVSSGVVNVQVPPLLEVLPITLPSRISRGQAFAVNVTVRNQGGTAANGVSLSGVTVGTSGTAGASLSALPAAVNLLPGASSVFTLTLTENGTGVGALTLTSAAAGTSALGGTVAASAVTSSAVTVETPAALAVSSFALPANIAVGASFALSMTVFNTGQASATNVLPVPSPPTATATGGVLATTTSAQTAVTIPGNSSATFTWVYTQGAMATGTLSFTGGARGTDANSLATRTAANASSNAAAVGGTLGCNGSAAYTGLGMRSLDGSRIDLVPGTDRLRVSPFPTLQGEMARTLGNTPASITGAGPLFGEASVRWYDEPEMSAIAMYQLLRSSFQGCLTFTASPTQYSVNPTLTTGRTECSAFMNRFWSRAPSSSQLDACAAFAADAVVNNDPSPRRRWAYVCAAVMSSVDFLAE